MEKVKLDFTGLFPVSTPPEPQREPVKLFYTLDALQQDEPQERVTEALSGITDDEEPEEPPAEQPEEQQNLDELEKILLADLRMKKAEERSLKVHREHQRREAAAGQLRDQIITGMNEGRDLFSLFTLAAEAISIMTDDPLFYREVKNNLLTVYGKGLGARQPLQNELREAQTRLQRLLAAEAEESLPDEKKRLRRAIEAHRREISELEAKLAEGKAA